MRDPRAEATKNFGEENDGEALLIHLSLSLTSAKDPVGLNFFFSPPQTE